MSKLKYSKNAIIALCSLVYFVSYFARKDFAAVQVEMIDSGAVNGVTAGLIGTALFVCYGAGQLVSGYLGDRIKPQYLLMAGLSATAFANLMMTFVTESSWMIPIWGLNGFAQAMLWPPIVKILSNHLDHERFVTANLIVTTAAHVATILLYLYVPICIRFMSWHSVFYSATVLAVTALVVFGIALYFVLPDKPGVEREAVRNSNPTFQTDKSFARILISAGIIPTFFSIIMMGFLRDGIESWLPTLYATAFDRDPSESVLVSVILPVFSIVSIVVITALHKRRLFNNEIVGSSLLFGSAIVAAIPLARLINVPGTICNLICLVLAAFICACMHGCNFLLISCLPGRFARVGRAATVSGFCNACVYIGAAVATYTIAIVSDKFGWQITVISWMGVAALGVVLTVLAVKAYSNFINQTK